MSQRRNKKQLSTIDNVNTLTDHELREALKGYNQAPGPITDSTRNLYRKKLSSLIDEEVEAPSKQNNSAKSIKSVNQGDAIIDQYFDDDTSDEDYNDEDEESDDEEEDEEEEEELDEEGSLVELVDELMYDEFKLAGRSGDLSTSMVATESSANFISRGILIAIISFFIAIFSLYLISQSKYNLSVPALPFKNFTRQLFGFLMLSTFIYGIYKTISYYRLRRHQENVRVCKLVDEALELLQSPDNPKGMMPILHIRDTLLTPAERKANEMIKLWTKAVKFIEEHESRVKVELVNIDGEDFRAWKWIGTRNM